MTKREKKKKSCVGKGENRGRVEKGRKEREKEKTKMLERGREGGTEGDIKKVMEVVRGGRVSHCLLAVSQRGGGGGERVVSWYEGYRRTIGEGTQ